MKLKSLVLLAVAAGALASPAVAKDGSKPTTVHIVATSQVETPPDVADIGAGVVTRAPQAQAALQANAEQMTRVVQALRKAGVAERDIQTSRLSLQPQYRYEERRSPVLEGYQAENRVQVRLRDLEQAGKIIDTLAAAGSNQIDGPSFRVDKPEPLLDKARQQAVADGRARAELYASAAGMRVSRIASIAERGGHTPPRPEMMMRAVAQSADAAQSPVAPGEVALNVTLDMVFELQ